MPSTSPSMEIPVPKLGVIADQDSLGDIPPGGLADAENWIYQDGEFKVRPGLTTLANDINQRPMGYHRYPHNDGNPRTVKATAAGWHRLAGTTWTDITQGGNALTGAVTDQQVFRVFPKAGATWLLGTNGANAPKKWDGNAANYLDIAGTPPRSRCMAVSFDRVLLGNLLSGSTISPVAIDVSENKDFDSGWGSILVALLADTPGHIVLMREMGNQVTAVYKDDAIYQAIAQGGTVPFRFEMRKEGISGPASTLSLAALSEGVHAYLAQDGSINIFDGAGLRSFSNNVQKFIADRINFSKLAQSWALYDSTAGLLYVTFVEQGASDLSLTVAIDMSSGSYWPLRWGSLQMSAMGNFETTTGTSIGEMVSPLGSYTQTIGSFGTSSGAKRLILGEIGGQTFEHMGDTDNGAAIAHFWETGLYPLSNGLAYKTIKEMEHRFKKSSGSQPVSVRIGASNNGEDRVLSTPKTLDIGRNGPYRTGHRTSAKFLSMRMDGSATKPIQYKGSSVIFEERGLR